MSAVAINFFLISDFKHCLALSRKEWDGYLLLGAMNLWGHSLQDGVASFKSFINHVTKCGKIAKRGSVSALGWQIEDFEMLDSTSVLCSKDSQCVYKCVCLSQEPFGLKYQ